MNDLRRATASLLAVSDSDEISANAPTPTVSMSLAEFNNLLFQIASYDGFEGETLEEFAKAFAASLNGNAVIEASAGVENFPEVGEDGALYLDTNTGKIYYYEDGEYKQANADTEITEKEIIEKIKNILDESPDSTKQAIEAAAKEYLKDNQDAVDNAIISYLVSNPEDVDGAINDYLNDNPEVITDGVKNFLNAGGGDMDTIVAEALKNAPTTLSDGVEKYLETKTDAVDNSVSNYLDKNPTKVSDAIEDYLNNKSDEFISEHYEIESNGETDAEAIEKALNGKTAIKNDIVIIKKLIIDDKYEYTSYYYDGKNWCAMSGNYNAGNVYFDCDFIITEPIGTIKELENGQAKIEAKGKNLTQILTSLFAQEKDPKITMPYVSITSTTAKNYEVGTIIKPTYTAAFVSGSYEFGPDTEIAAIKWNIINNLSNEESSSPSGKFAAFEVTDDTNLTITATASYNEGTIPVSNLGNAKENIRIKAGTASKTSAALKGYRKTFFGVTMDTEELTSDVIRELSSSTSGLKDGSTFSINVGEGAARVIIAYPANLCYISSDKKDGKYEIADKFNMTKMEIEGNNGYKAIEYKVYTRIFDSEREEDCVYNVII